MQIAHRRCWTLTGAKIEFENLPVKIVEEGKRVEVSRLSPGRGIVIRKGKAYLVKESGSQEVVLGELLEGDMVGTMSENRPARSHTVLIFESEAEISPVMWEMLEEKVLPALKEFVFETKTFFKKGSFRLYPAEYLHPDPIVRTARFLWKISEFNPEKKAPGKVQVDLDLSHLSGYLFMTEGETALAMGHFQSDGIISLRAGGVSIEDKDRLERHCIWQLK